MNILITGSAGFAGSHLCLAIERMGQHRVLCYDLGQTLDDLALLANEADMVFHFAGVNRPQNPDEFMQGNSDLTRFLCDNLAVTGRKIPFALSSSIQAALDNPYGASKKVAEDTVRAYHAATGSPVYIYRFPNLFGKWSRPNYNTVVATFCHNVAHGLPVNINNRESEIPFLYIDDLVRECLAIIERSEHDPVKTDYVAAPELSISVGDLYDRIAAFHAGRNTKRLPDFSDTLTKYLYSTYLAFLPEADFARAADVKTDERGWLFELIKSPAAGQIFISKTHLGITRGNHYHDTKVEKFCVIQGQGIIRFRKVTSEEIIEYPVSDEKIQIVDIPPGYTHSIENTGSSEMLTIFWASEPFDSTRPDTYFVPVQ